MLYIGVDLGTSAVKLLLMNGEGKIEKIVSREYPLSFPHPLLGKIICAVHKTQHFYKTFDFVQVAGFGLNVCQKV